MVQSIKYDLRAINLAKSQHNYEQLANVKYNLGITLKNLDLFSEALNFIQEAKIYYDSTDNKRSVALCLGGLATISSNQGNIEEAIELYKKKYAILKKLGNKRLGSVLGNIGNNYRELGVLDSARWYIEESRKFKERSKNRRGLAFNYRQSGLLNLLEKDTNAAEQNFLSSIKLMSEMKLLFEKNELANHLAEIYFNQKKFEKAAYYQKMANVLADSLFSLKKTSETNKLLIKEELKNYVKKIESLETSLSKKQNLLEDTRKNKSLQIGIGFIVFIGLLWIILRQKKQLKSNQEIAAQLNKNLNQKVVQETSVIKLTAENGKDEIVFKLEDLLFFEANHNYVNIHLKNEIKRIRLKLKMVEKQLADNSVIARTHRAFIVNTIQIDKIFSNTRLVKIKLKDSDIQIPVSRTYHADFKSSLQK